MYKGKYSLQNNITSWLAGSVVTLSCVYRIRLWSVRRDDHLGVLIAAGGTRRYDWPACASSNDISTAID